MSFFNKLAAYMGLIYCLTWPPIMILDSILLCVSTPADQTIDLAMRISMTVLQGGLLVGMIWMVVAMFCCIHNMTVTTYFDSEKDRDDERAERNYRYTPKYSYLSNKARLETCTIILIIMLVIHSIASIIFNKSGHLTL